MKNYIITCLITIVFGYGGESIYPLPYTFNDKNFYVHGVVSEMLNIKEFSLKSANDDRLFLKENMYIPSKCIKIMQFDDVINFEKLESDYSYCKKIFHYFYSDFLKKIESKEVIIYIYQNEKDNSNRNAIIVRNKKIIGVMGYFSVNNTFIEFNKILLSIDKNNELHDIKYYLNKAKKYLNNNYLNLALKNLISAQLLDSNNNQLDSRLQKLFILLFDKQKTLIDLNRSRTSSDNTKSKNNPNLNPKCNF